VDLFCLRLFNDDIFVAWVTERRMVITNCNECRSQPWCILK